jgi:ArsR family transcriptional regulator
MQATVQVAEQGQTMASKIEKQVVVFKALGNTNRVKIIRLLAQHEELCVCEVVSALKHGQSLASYHLRILEQVGLVSYRWEGTWSYYKLNRNRLMEILSAPQCEALLE